MALVVQEKPFICFLSVDTGFNFHANEWQSIVGCYFHLDGGVGFIKICQQIGGVGEVVYQSQCENNHNDSICLVQNNSSLFRSNGNY